MLRKGIPEEVLDNAKCVLVVPLSRQGWFLLLVERHGLAGSPQVAPRNRLERSGILKWVGGGSWGLQIGVEGVDLVMLVMNEQGICSICF